MFSEISFNDKKVDMVRTEVGMVWKDNYRAKAWLVFTWGLRCLGSWEHEARNARATI